MKKLIIASDIHGSARWCGRLLEYFEKRGIAIFRDDRYYPNLYIFRLTLQALEQEERIRAHD